MNLKNEKYFRNMGIPRTTIVKKEEIIQAPVEVKKKEIKSNYESDSEDSMETALNEILKNKPKNKIVREFFRKYIESLDED